MNKLIGKFALVALVLLGSVMPVSAEGDIKVSFQADASAYPVINLYVSATDASGQPIVGLAKENFEITEDGQPVVIEDFAGVGDPRPVDIVFVFDVTGSMREEIEGVKQTCVKFAERLASTGRDYRLGLVTFLDAIGQVYRPDNSLTGDVQEFKRWISSQRANGGDDDPEIALDALLRAAQMQFRPKAQRILILITDAPPHVRSDGTRFSKTTFGDTIDTLKKSNITVYAIAPNQTLLSRYRFVGDDHYEHLAAALGGQFYDIQRNPDFTGIIDAIGVAISTQYKLTYRTPRPTPDGTLRDIRVKVSKEGKSGGGGGGYLERHLLNVKSNPLVGLACLLPLLVALAAPAAVMALRRPTVTAPQPIAAPPFEGAYPAALPVPTSPIYPSYPAGTPPTQGTYPAQPHAPTAPVYPPPAPIAPAFQPPPAVTAVCSRCGASLRPGAKFCAKCGAVQGASSTASAIPNACPRCGNRVKPGAKFCNRCGQAL